MAVTPAITVTILPVRFISFDRPLLIYFLSHHPVYQVDKTSALTKPTFQNNKGQVRVLGTGNVYISINGTRIKGQLN